MNKIKGYKLIYALIFTKTIMETQYIYNIHFKIYDILAVLNAQECILIYY